MADLVQFVQDKNTNNQYSGRDYYLLTMHRPYNVDDPERLKKLFAGLAQLNQDIVFPIHPRTRNIAETHQIVIPENVELIKPQGYIEFQGLIKYAQKIITDSGGLQKEAYIAGKPCITLRPAHLFPAKRNRMGRNSGCRMESADGCSRSQTGKED